MRASTIRKKVREWRKLRNFCLGACGCPWPSHVGVVLDYLRERVDEPCGRTVPEAVASAIAFMEKVGCVPGPERMSASQILRNFVNQATHDLEVGAPLTRKAPLLPLVMVGALELMVVDVQAPLYARGLAFCKLLKLWTACRSSDLCGLNPSSLRLNRLGLVGVLEKTKTTGAGKRIRHLPIYICHSAYFMAPDWLTVGWKVWSDPEMSFGRDYFLPLPKPDWTGVCTRMAEYADSAGLSVQLLRRMHVPRRQGSTWVQSKHPLLICDAAAVFWKEHSERNWLNSMLAAIEVSKELRDYVGRWHVSSSDEYLRTAQQVVIGLQERLVNYFCGPDRWDLRSAGLDELETHLRARGVAPGQIQCQCSNFHLPAKWCLRVPEPLVPAPSVCAEAVETVEDVDDADLHSPFFDTVVGKKRLRRLHRRGGCGVSVLEVQESEPVWDLKGLVCNLACQHCWRPGESTVSEAEEADDSGSASDGED